MTLWRIAAEYGRGDGGFPEDEVVGAALEEEIKQRNRLRILDLFGKVEYYPDYDYKELRRKKRG